MREITEMTEMPRPTEEYIYIDPLEYHKRKRKERYNDPDLRTDIVIMGLISAFSIVLTMQAFQYLGDIDRAADLERASRQEIVHELGTEDGFDLAETDIIRSSIDGSYSAQTDVMIDSTCTLTGVTINFVKDSSAASSDPEISEIASYSIPVQSGVLTVLNQPQLAELAGANPCVSLNHN